MKLINRHEKCVGIVLWKWGQKLIQLWYCPSEYQIKPHSHPEENIELMYLFGDTTFSRIKHRWDGDYIEDFTPHWYDCFRKFTVKAGQVHWFTVSELPLLFINISTFKRGYKPKSAAVDFKLLHK